MLHVWFQYSIYPGGAISLFCVCAWMIAQGFPEGKKGRRVICRQMMKTAGVGLHLKWFLGCCKGKGGEKKNRQEQRAPRTWREGKRRTVRNTFALSLLNSGQMAKRPALLLPNSTSQGHLPSTSGALVRGSRLSSPMPNAQEMQCPLTPAPFLA